ncbi:MAG: NUDIX domain-containing protein [Candidatus Kerfeldbacteria bacterium]|nr:NUDIX domain-containing protein [Candidatus Kerfeldbacteria bacterium]
MTKKSGITLCIAIKAFIVFEGKVLIVREAPTNPVGTNAGKFDVVGGRLAPGERFDETLRREIREETGLTVERGQPFHVALVATSRAWRTVADYWRVFCLSGQD